MNQRVAGPSITTLPMRLCPLIVAISLLPACSDFNLAGLDKDANIDEDSVDTAFDPEEEDLGACEPAEFPAESCALDDSCHFEVGGFEPTVVWESDDSYVASLPVVGDLDHDGMPDIVLNEAFILSTGELQAYRGDGSGSLWKTANAETGFGAHPALADLDGDGWTEVLVVRTYELSLFGTGDYTVVAFDHEGNEIAESEHFVDAEFDYATGVIVSDMDHDGSPEVVAGRAILNADLSTRGVGQEGRGCPAYVGVFMYGEGAQPAIADMDLDGIEEVIVGNAFYDPDGRTIMKINGGTDGAVAIANLDGDPEAEFVRSSYGVIQAYDTDGSTIWGPLTNKSANILAIPAIADVDSDGKAEVVTAGGNVMWVLNGEDGSILWQTRVHDETGATGASFFDFEGDGMLEIVYIDEVAMYAFAGIDGTVKFQSNAHASDTMYDYPVIVDVDANGHADILVAHDQYGPGMSVYRDIADSWAPARQVWNQHSYVITNINDDLSVPQNATPNFTIYNSFHSGVAMPPGEAIGADLSAEILASCDDDCDRGWFIVTARIQNNGTSEVPAGSLVSLYAEKDGVETILLTDEIPEAVPSAMTSEAVTFVVAKADIEDADALWVYADDNGSRTGIITECDESDNGAILKKPFCGK